MRDINLIMIHCTDTPEGRDVTAEEVNEWHRQRGYEMIGYHFLIRLNGDIESGRPLFMKGAACRKGRANDFGVHVCYAGGRDNRGDTADTRTPKQRESLLMLLKWLKRRFPKARIVGHRDFDRGKACPCYDAKNEYMNL
jgi:N-acetylmuramoyl-L-alanine amidase